MASGPTSFVENGRRKSGRTNIIPLELQPPAEKRQTRAAIQKVVEDRVKQHRPSYKYTSRSNNEDSKRPMSAGKPTPNSPSTASKVTTVKKEGTPYKHRKSLSYSHSSIHHVRDNTPQQPTSKQSKNNHIRTMSSASNTTNVNIPYANGHEETDNTGEEDYSDAAPVAFSPQTKLQRITFRVKLPTPAIQTPANIPAAKKHSTFQEFLDKDETEPKAGESFLTAKQVLQEASARRMVQKAKARGRALDKKLDEILPDRQKEPDRQWAHHDHLIAHLRHFRRLLRTEHLAHQKQAKRVADEAVKYLDVKRHKNKVKTAEEVAAEETAETRNKHQDVFRDLERQWALVEAEVNRFRLATWEQEQQALGKQHLNRVLEQHTQMLESRFPRNSSELVSDESRSDADSGGSEMTTDEDDDSNMSDASESGADGDGPADDDDAILTREQLMQKYAHLPTKLVSEKEADEQSEEIAHGTSDGTSQELEDKPGDAQEALGTESDPSVDMDSDGTNISEEEDDSNDEEEQDDTDEDETAGDGMLGFLSKSEVAAVTDVSMEDVAEETDSPDVHDHTEERPLVHVDIEDVHHEMTHDPSTEVDKAIFNVTEEDETLGDQASRESSTQASPRTSATKASEAESTSSVEPHPDNQRMSTSLDHKPSSIKTPVPSLLRGTLREYQHQGLDWLAGLYANNRNGILADEMGLGKTIQSIALLAHLAVEHEVWGPHLIIVPTSVMLNWEMEFKKFCPGFKILTYYGTQEERRQKRRGWNRDDLWNVCITSYQLVLQDQTVFKRRNWHYMILDEAHNIKNFRSQRWQAMLTFKTRARLLLTGTPLQNNLTELWSLLFFLRPTDTADDEDEAFAGLAEFSEWFRKPVNQILEHGRDAMDDEGREQVTKLHKVIRPYLLRRLKADVEKQMPGKYEHVELCRLSKRQRQLYDGFMSRSQTKETLASGNYLSIINCLMQLRKVCNHPDLFETRPITTSFAMSKSAVANFEIRDLVVRRRFLQDGKLGERNLEFLQLVPISREDKSAIEVIECSRLMAFSKLQSLREGQYQRTNWQMAYNGSSASDVLASLENVGRQNRMAELERALYFESHRHRQRPIYGAGLLKRLAMFPIRQRLADASRNPTMAKQWDTQLPPTYRHLVQSVVNRSIMMQPSIQKFACVTPAVVATDMAVTTLSEVGVAAVRENRNKWGIDPFHESRTRLSIAFPDKRLLQYDCGKLQRLDQLLRKLQAGGHRALIFTQMTKVLDILEQFLNIHGHRYLRLDGATKIEQRQILTDRFNNDNRILAFILSSRSGGLGINLTGADTVIFYDLDWNPAMDKQCQDRCHRIGQTRDVHIYRFVSEHTIESNILRKSNQKRMLDDVIIQEGDFTTDYLNKLSVGDMLGDDIGDGDAEASAAMDRVLGNRGGGIDFEQVEDKEDIAAAKVAEKEDQNADDGDFEDTVVSQDANAIPRTGEGPFSATNAPLIEAADADQEDDRIRHIDDYMLRMKTWLLHDVPIMPLAMKNKKSKKRGREHRTKRAR